MQTRSALQKQADIWLAEAAVVPPGNGAEADLWGGGSNGATVSEASVDVAAMSPAELAEYEERKLKMRKAMGEGMRDDDKIEEVVDNEERRQRMINAVTVRTGV